MILRELRVDGFGKLRDRTIAFDPAFNVVFGPNEAGKSTLTAALLASLYGLGRGDKDRYRPWSGAPFATALRYELARGGTFEVQRDFERDAKGVRVYDEHGNDASGDCAVGKVVSPGHAHLGIPLEVFLNASFVAQGDAAIDGARAERITHALARALDGGPKEDAALGAMQRLDAALAAHVGKKKATVNAPLRHLIDEIAETQARADAMRAQVRALDDVRARLETETARQGELETALREQERRGRSLRTYTLRSRLDALRDIRGDLAALQAERALYDDADGFQNAYVANLEMLYREWYALDALARSHASDAERGRMTPALRSELEEREADGGALDDAAFAQLEATVATAASARDRATVAAEAVQGARRAAEGGSELSGAALSAAFFVSLGAGVLGVARDWWLAAVVAVLAVVLLAFAFARVRRRRGAVRTINAMQRSADEASAAERAAAATVAAALEPLGVPSFDELAKRRARAGDLRARQRDAARLAAQAAATRRETVAAADAFDRLAERLVDPTGSRERDLAAAKARESRKIARDGIDLRLYMLDVRRSDVLGTDDEYALERELAELVACGIEPVADGASPRAFEAERADLERRASESRSVVAATAAELRTAELQIGDLAAADERVERLRASAAALEAFETAVTLARTTIDERTRETHRTFARRLADYASRTFAAVTGERYRDVRVDPTTLAVRVRVPETGEIVDVDRLSAGTREQAYLVVRLAMVRMFSEGLEIAPLLLDDPFAFWDDARIARCLPILMPDTSDGAQTVIFTTSRALVSAAAALGARTIDLTVAGEAALGRGALDGDQDLTLLSQA
ncbi:MAG: hypothetical protein NVSMB19_14240 [Vulcanimicrobiaceae bacterium]